MFKQYTTTQLRHEVGEVKVRVIEAAQELPPPTINEVMDSMERLFDERSIRSGVSEAIASGQVGIQGGNTLVITN